FVPANCRSKSLADAAGGTRTNRAGSVVIQVEALYFPYCRVGTQVYPRLVDTPCKGWPELQAWVHSWGVPLVWPMGHPSSFAPNRSESVWETTAGWYGHSQVPENTHQDPGSWPGFVGAPTSPKYEPFPGASWFVMGRRSPIVTAMHDRLVAVGCNRYQSSKNKDVIGSGDVASYEAWQRKCGFTGTAATWPPGKTTWDLLKVPNV
ncbi:peptidoglycan-binding protein, partial [Streptomyces capoamus]|uniref:peptidoglycan-binding protein n=1 Tax=Streptomyces capoamus TaxID=68183 RepID=UPI00167C20FB